MEWYTDIQESVTSERDHTTLSESVHIIGKENQPTVAGLATLAGRALQLGRRKAPRVARLATGWISIRDGFLPP